MSDRSHSLLYHAKYWATFATLTLASSLRFAGRRHMPRRGPVLVIANHQSYLDPSLVGVASPRPLRYLARKTLFRHPAFAWFIRQLGALPVDQEGVAKEGLKVVLEELRQGQAVVVFPEGQRTFDGKLQPLMPGIHLLLRRSQAPIVPVGIAGAFTALPRTRHWPKLSPLFLPPTDSTLAVYIGRPLDGRRYAELARAQALAELFEELQKVHDRAEKLRRK
jgi:1-acyl-sn-glycerol-3-phosphate acyltransferase